MFSLSRRSFLLGAVPAASAVVLPERKGAKVPSQAVQFADPLTERRMWRLTDPAVLHHLPHYYHRFISRRRSFLLLASELTGARQIYRMDLPDGEMVQLTSGPGVHSYSPVLDPSERSCFLLQGNALKMLAVSNGRERHIYECPGDWRFTGHLDVSDDGATVALIEMRADYWAEGFEEQFRRRPRCRLRLVDTKRGGSRVLIDERNWFSHPQFRRGGKEILYRHEGPWDQVTDRLWLSGLDGSPRKLRARQGEEQVGHEYWLTDGSGICYVHTPDATGRGTTVRYLDVESREERVLARCTRFGWLSGNTDNSVVVGASSSVASPNIYVLFAALHREITVCEHASSGKPYPIAGTNSMDSAASWPEPVFSPDSRWVYFASDKEGQPAIYRIDVSDLVEDT